MNRQGCLVLVALFVVTWAAVAAMVVAGLVVLR